METQKLSENGAFLTMGENKDKIVVSTGFHNPQAAILYDSEITRLVDILTDGLPDLIRRYLQAQQTHRATGSFETSMQLSTLESELREKLDANLGVDKEWLKR